MHTDETIKIQLCGARLLAGHHRPGDSAAGQGRPERPIRRPIPGSCHVPTIIPNRRLLARNRAQRAGGLQMFCPNHTKKGFNYIRVHSFQEGGPKPCLPFYRRALQPSSN